MITIFFNEHGYYITGNGVEIARRCSPASTQRGDMIFSPQHHTYKVLYLALCEIYKTQTQYDIMVYNDSRIIDEINNNIQPLDTVCQEWLKTLQRNVIPFIKSVVFFRKKSATYVRTAIEASHQSMLYRIDHKQRQAIVKTETKIQKALVKTKRKSLIDKFKESWFGENKNGK